MTSRKRPARAFGIAERSLIFSATAAAACAVIAIDNVTPLMQRWREFRQASLTVTAANMSTKQAHYLIRTHFNRLKNALDSGNFTVLRDLGARRLQDRMTAADLALQLQPIADARLDLSAAQSIDHSILRVAPTASGAVTVSGLVRTGTSPYDFAMTFEAKDGAWALAEITVSAAAMPLAAFQPSR